MSPQSWPTDLDLQIVTVVGAQAAGLLGMR
jgi:hypothetical protein